MILPDRFISQGESVTSLLRQIREGRMTHALLISGEEGVGKWTLAIGLATMLLCEAPRPDGLPCGKCRSCVQMENLSHPDLIVLEKGAPISSTTSRTVIPVSDIVEMTRRISQQGYESNGHVVLIHQAEDMNDASQNKLLKTLEEPPDGTFFMLTCTKPDLLLTTVISRCRPLKLHPWGDDEVMRALMEQGIEEERAREAVWGAGGSFGRALKTALDDQFWQFRDAVIKDFLGCRERSDILRISTKWKDQKDQAEAVLSVLESCFSRMMRRSFSEPGTEKTAIDLPEPWVQFANRAGPEDYVFLFDAVELARKRVHYSVNFQAVTEQLILSLTEAAD